jgi:hypothetical protein
VQLSQQLASLRVRGLSRWDLGRFPAGTVTTARAAGLVRYTTYVQPGRASSLAMIRAAGFGVSSTATAQTWPTCGPRPADGQ